MGLSKALWIKVKVWRSKGRKRGFALRESLVMEDLKKMEDARFHIEQGWTGVQIKSSVLIEQMVVNSTKGRVYSICIRNHRFL